MGDRKRQLCSGAQGLVVEAVKVLAETKNQAMKDTVVSGAVTKAEHYEMVAYKDLIASVEMMGKTKVARASRAQSRTRSGSSATL